MDLWSFVTLAVGPWPIVKKVVSSLCLDLVELAEHHDCMLGQARGAGQNVQRWLLLQKK